jgi:hypothetical protein
MGQISNLKIYDKEIYKRVEKTLMLMEGDYDERHFVIVRHECGHPNAYIEVKKDDKITTEKPSKLAQEYGFDDRYEAFSGMVHYGATYYGKAYWNPEDDRTYIGWDYGHCDDYNSNQTWQGGHKWNFTEILMDVAHAVDGFYRDNYDI